MATPTYRRDKPENSPLTWSEMDGNLDWVEEQMTASETARDAAILAKTQTDIIKGQAEEARDDAQDAALASANAAGQSQTYAAAAQSAAGIPALAGHGGKWFRVKEDESGVEWAEIEFPEQDYPGTGIARSDGTGWMNSLAVPGGSLVGTTANQTLSSKTFGSTTRESQSSSSSGDYSISTSTAPVIWLTPSSNLTLTETISGQTSNYYARTLLINPGNNTVMWPASFDWLGEDAPDLVANKVNIIEIMNSGVSGVVIAVYGGALS